MKKIRTFILLALALCLCVGIDCSASAKTKKKVKLNKTKLTLTEGKTYKLKLKNNKKKVKWSSAKKSVATVSSVGKIRAKKAGRATITAKASGRKYKCRVTVKAKVKKKVVSDDGKSFTKTVSPDYQANYARLKEYIQLYGVTNDSGNKTLNGTMSYKSMDVVYGIVYDAANQKFDFMLITDTLLEDDTAALGALVLSVSEADIAKGAASYGVVYELGYYGEASGTYSLADIHSANNSLAWEMGDSDLDNIHQLANLSVDLGYIYWESILEDHHISLTLTDLGFGA